MSSLDAGPFVVVATIGYTALSGTARSNLSSLRQYGLVDDTPNGVRISDLALNILVQPENSKERAQALWEASRKPNIIAELAESHADASDDSLRAYLITKRKFSADGAGRFLGTFRDALTLANPNGSGDSERKGDDGKPDAGSGVKHPVQEKPKEQDRPLKQDPGGRMEFTWPLSGDAVATLTVSRPFDADDLAMLKDYFALAERVLKKAAKSERAAAVALTGASDAGEKDE